MYRNINRSHLYNTYMSLEILSVIKIVQFKRNLYFGQKSFIIRERKGILRL